MCASLHRSAYSSGFDVARAAIPVHSAHHRQQRFKLGQRVAQFAQQFGRLLK